MSARPVLIFDLDGTLSDPSVGIGRSHVDELESALPDLFVESAHELLVLAGLGERG